jgi:hypothetical protein
MGDLLKPALDRGDTFRHDRRHSEGLTILLSVAFTDGSVPEAAQGIGKFGSGYAPNSRSSSLKFNGHRHVSADAVSTDSAIAPVVGVGRWCILMPLIHRFGE